MDCAPSIMVTLPREVWVTLCRALSPANRCVDLSFMQGTGAHHFLLQTPKNQLVYFIAEAATADEGSDHGDSAHDRKEQPTDT